MYSPIFRVIGAILIAAALLAFLFHGSVGSMQGQATVHSTLPSASGAGK